MPTCHVTDARLRQHCSLSFRRFSTRSLMAAFLVAAAMLLAAGISAADLASNPAGLPPLLASPSQLPPPPQPPPPPLATAFATLTAESAELGWRVERCSTNCSSRMVGRERDPARGGGAAARLCRSHSLSFSLHFLTSLPSPRRARSVAALRAIRPGGASPADGGRRTCAALQGPVRSSSGGLFVRVHVRMFMWLGGRASALTDARLC